MALRVWGHQELCRHWWLCSPWGPGASGSDVSAFWFCPRQGSLRAGGLLEGVEPSLPGGNEDGTGAILLG